MSWGLTPQKLTKTGQTQAIGSMIYARFFDPQGNCKQVSIKFIGLTFPSVTLFRVCTTYLWDLMLKKRWISKQSYLCQLFKAMGNCKQGSVKFVGLKLSSWTDGSIFVALENRKKLVLKYFGLIFPSGSLIWCFLIVNFLFSNPFRCLNSCLTRL